MKHLTDIIKESLFDDDLVTKDLISPETICDELGIDKTSKNLRDIKLMLKTLYKEFTFNNLIGFCRDWNAEDRLEYEWPKSLIDGVLVIAIYDVPGKDWNRFYSWNNQDKEFEDYEDLSDIRDANNAYLLI